MTDISVQSTSRPAEKRGWLRGPHGTEPGANPSATLDATLFTPAAHYPAGVIPSGIVLGRVASTGYYGPYDPAAEDGREIPRGLLFGSLAVRHPESKPAGALVVHGFVNPDRLPISSGSGSLTEEAQTQLTHIVWD